MEINQNERIQYVQGDLIEVQIQVIQENGPETNPMTCRIDECDKIQQNQDQDKKKREQKQKEQIEWDGLSDRQKLEKMQLIQDEEEKRKKQEQKNQDKIEWNKLSTKQKIKFIYHQNVGCFSCIVYFFVLTLFVIGTVMQVKDEIDIAFASFIVGSCLLVATCLINNLGPYGALICVYGILFYFFVDGVLLYTRGQKGTGIERMVIFLVVMCYFTFCVCQVKK